MGAFGTVTEGGGEGEVGCVLRQRHLAIHGGGIGILGLTGERTFLVEFVSGHGWRTGWCVAPLDMDRLTCSCGRDGQPAKKRDEQADYSVVHR